MGNAVSPKTLLFCPFCGSTEFAMIEHWDNAMVNCKSCGETYKVVRPGQPALKNRRWKDLKSKKEKHGKNIGPVEA